MSLQPIRGVEGSDYINASFVDVSVLTAVYWASILDCLYRRNDVIMSGQGF